ncbi:hypothetical protein Prudu_016706 [Prunus dulcis]|uniref:Integrase catalytic domain-containing protein n=1 Tax=Prunus dulcis TaxID=3755 RepID=A0A4Y1RNQ7_PRUDU|nr:hypothetical protein Prudu_016706 [Prunus dulcis]
MVFSYCYHGITSYQLESVLQGYDLFGHFDGSFVSPPKFAIVDEEGATSELTAAYKDWICTDKALLSLLIASFQMKHLSMSSGVKQLERPGFISTAQKGGDSIERFLLRLKHIRDQLRGCCAHFDDDFVIAALNGLPPEYAIIKTVLTARDSPITLKDFHAQLLAAEQTAETRIVHHSGLYAANSSSSAQPSSVASGQGLLPTPSHSLPPPSRGFSSGRGRFTGGRNQQSLFRSSGFRGAPSSNFGGSGSYKQTRSYGGELLFSNAPSSDASSPVVECQICGKRGHAALDCYHRSNYAFQGQAPPSSLTAMTAQSSYSPKQVWIIDTGASHHMVGNASHLHNITSCDVTRMSLLVMGKDKLTKKIVLQGKSNQGLYHIPLATSSVLNRASCFSSAPVAYLGQQIKSSLWHKSTQFGAHLQYFKNDGGGEFNSSQFASFLASKGIIHQLSCPSTPQQNGLAERKNRHVIETALTLLVPANLPGQFWYHAVAHAAYLINFMPRLLLEISLLVKQSSLPYMPHPMHPMQTRSKSGIVKPKPFEEYQCYLTTILSLHDVVELATYKAASQSSVWIQAMREEIEALHTQGTWDLVSVPVDKNIVGSRWVYRVKKNSDGSVARHNVITQTLINI